MENTIEPKSAYTQADLAKARATTKRITDSLERGMTVISQLETEARAATSTLPNPLPPILAEKLQAWSGLLTRYEQAADHEKAIAAILKAQQSKSNTNPLIARLGGKGAV